MKIAVAGMGYVGLSLAMLLAQHNDVRIFDVVPEKVTLLNQGKSPIADEEIDLFLRKRSKGALQLNLAATQSEREAYENADFAIVATPTNYDPQKNFFDTSSVEAAISAIRAANKTAWIVIKSTIPVGYSQKLSDRLGDERIIFSPNSCERERPFTTIFTLRVLLLARQRTTKRSRPRKLLRIFC